MRSIALRSLVLAAGAALALSGCNSKPTGAQVTVFEYASPTCPHCAAWETEVWPQFKAKYIDTGKVNYTLREAPIHGAVDVAAFLLAKCAPKDKYLDVIQAVMRAQPDFFDGLGRGDMGPYRTTLMNIAQSVGISEQKAGECISDGKAADELKNRSEKQMKEFAVESTPTFVVNGKKMDDQHPPSMAELGAVIDPLLAKK